MTLDAARSFLMTDRMDWRKPHLNWVSAKLYRYASTLYVKSRDD